MLNESQTGAYRWSDRVTGWLTDWLLVNLCILVSPWHNLESPALFTAMISSASRTSDDDDDTRTLQVIRDESCNNYCCAMRKLHGGKKRCNLVLLISFFQKDTKATFVFSRDFLIRKKKLIIPNYWFLWRATFVMQYFFFLCKKMYTRIILLHILVFFNRNENYGFIKSP